MNFRTCFGKINHENIDTLTVIHVWHFRTRNCTFKMWQIFPEPRDNFGSLVANLRIVKLLKLLELILVRVFLEGYLRVIGRQMVSHGSKWYQYCHGYGQFFLLEAFERNGVFCSKSKKCNNFGLYRLRCTSLFSFCFWFVYKTRCLFKFVCFLFLTKCARKDNIIAFTKATRNRIFNVAEYMRKTQLGCCSWRGEQKCKIYSSGSIRDYIPR
jgi:hypothetical protein